MPVPVDRPGAAESEVGGVGPFTGMGIVPEDGARGDRPMPVRPIQRARKPITWVTFVPCFPFILLGAPYVERLRGNRTLATALTGVTAAVVGVIASLAVFFALHTLFADTTRVTTGPLNVEVPVLDSIQWAALTITALGCGLIFWRG